MNQVVVQASMDAFMNALDLQRRYHPLIDANCLSGGQLVLKIAQAYDVKVQVRSNETRLANRDRLTKFYNERCKVRLCFQDNKAVGGYVVLDGELLCLHNVEKGKGRWMVANAISDGAVKLDYFDVPVLRELYEQNGFVEYRRVPNYKEGEPDVVYAALCSTARAYQVDLDT